MVLLSAALALGGPPSAVAQVAQHQRVQEAVAAVQVWLEAQMAYEQIPSVSGAIVHDQELVWSGAMGMAHRDQGVPATTETLYSICSISKLFTSVSVMQLRDRGLLDLRDPLTQHLPWFTLEQQYEGSDEVTVEGVLTHSAGLPRESDHPYWTGPDFPFPTREEVIAGLPDQETLYPAWKYFQYSNLGLTMAGELVTALSGIPYGDYVRANILTPLGMDNTYPEIPAEHRGGRLATGYSSLTRDGRREEVAFFQARGIAPAAGYASTPEDLARFASWQFRLTGNREEVLRAHTLEEMQRVHYVDPEWNTFWGLGFSVMRIKDKTFVGHGGSCPGFRSHLLLQTDEKVATVFMANGMVNSNKFTSGMYDLMSEAIKEATRENGEGAEDEARDQEEAPPDLTPYLGAYSQQPWGGETAAIRWKGGLALMGLPTDTPVRAITRLKHVEGDVFRRIRSDDELGETIRFERDAQGRVTGFRQHGQFSVRVR